MSRWFLRVLVLAALIQSTVYAVRPMVSYKAIALGAEGFVLGIVVASFAVVPLVAVVPLGRVADRWDERLLIVLGSAAMAAASVTLVLAETLVWLVVCHALVGSGQAMSVVGIQTVVARGARADRRDRRLALVTVMNSLGLLLGPAVAGMLAGHTTVAADAAGGQVHNSHLVFGFAALSSTLCALIGVSLIVVPGTLAQRPPKNPAAVPPTSREAVAAVLREAGMPSAIFASLTVLSAVDIVTSYLPVYAESRDIPVRVVGFLLAANGAASVLARLAMLPLLALLPRKTVLILSMVCAAAGLSLLPFVTSLAVLYLLMLVTGFGLGLGQPVTLAWVAARAPRELRGTALGLRISGNRLGQATIPAVVGTLGGLIGIAALFLAPAVLLGLSLAAVVASRLDD